MPNRVTFLVPEELDRVMRAVPGAPSGEIEDDLRAIFLLGLLCACFDSMGEHDVSLKLLAMNREELKLG